MPKKPSAISVTLQYPSAYILSAMTNRYAIQREEGFTLAHFGLISQSSTLLDRFTCVFTEHTLKSLKENLVQYSDKVGRPKKAMPSWTPPIREAKEGYLLPVVDFVHLSHWDNAHAEICFWNYSQGHVADMIKVKDFTIRPWGVAMLRCDIDLQRGFLYDLYDV